MSAPAARHEVFRVATQSDVWLETGRTCETSHDVTRTSGVAVRRSNGHQLSTRLWHSSGSTPPSLPSLGDGRFEVDAVTGSSYGELDGIPTPLAAVAKATIAAGQRVSAVPAPPEHGHDLAQVGASLFEVVGPHRRSLETLRLRRTSVAFGVERIDGWALDWSAFQTEVSLRARLAEDDQLLAMTVGGWDPSAVSPDIHRLREHLGEALALTSLPVVRLRDRLPLLLQPLAAAQLFRAVLMARDSRPTGHDQDDNPAVGVEIWDDPLLPTVRFSPVDHIGVPTAPRRVMSTSGWDGIRAVREVDGRPVHLGRMYRNGYRVSPRPAVRMPVVYCPSAHVPQPETYLRVESLDMPTVRPGPRTNRAAWTSRIESEFVGFIVAGGVTQARSARGRFEITVDDVLRSGHGCSEPTPTPLDVVTPSLLLTDRFILEWSSHS